MTEPSWIARGVADRFVKEHPDIQDWKVFAVTHGFRLKWMPLPPGRAAFMIGKTIFIQVGLSESEEQDAVRHEICHRHLHGCNMVWWEGRPYGKYIISKYERQVQDLARLLS